MEFSRKEYWGGLPFPSLGGLLSGGLNLVSHIVGRCFYSLSHQGSPNNPIDWQLEACVLFFSRRRYSRFLLVFLFCWLSAVENWHLRPPTPRPLPLWELPAVHPSSGTRKGAPLRHLKPSWGTRTATATRKEVGGVLKTPGSRAGQEGSKGSSSRGVKGWGHGCLHFVWGCWVHRDRCHRQGGSSHRHLHRSGAQVPGDHEHRCDQEAQVVCNASATTTRFAGAVGSAAAAGGLGMRVLLLAFLGFCPPVCPNLPSFRYTDMWLSLVSWWVGQRELFELWMFC